MIQFYLLCRDPTTGWGSLNYSQLAILFDALPDSNNPVKGNSSNSGPSVEAVDIAIIIVVVVVVMSVLSMCVKCFYKNFKQRQTQSYEPPRDAEFIIISTDSADIPMTVAEPATPTANPRVIAYAVVNNDPEVML